MHLTVSSKTSREASEEDLDLAVHVVEDEIPVILAHQGAPQPDRHLLVGLTQTAAMAVGEQDEDIYLSCPNGIAVLERGTETHEFTEGMLMVRSSAGRIKAIGLGNHENIRRLSRSALRYFTGTIRLDVP